MHEPCMCARDSGRNVPPCIFQNLFIFILFDALTRAFGSEGEFRLCHHVMTIGGKYDPPCIIQNAFIIIMVTAIITDKPYERVIFFQATSQYYELRTTLRTTRHHWGYAQSNESRTTFVGASPQRCRRSDVAPTGLCATFV